MGVCDYEVLHTGKDGFVLGDQGDSGVDIIMSLPYAHLLQAHHHWNDTKRVVLQIGCTRFLGPFGIC